MSNHQLTPVRVAEVRRQATARLTATRGDHAWTEYESDAGQPDTILALLDALEAAQRLPDGYVVGYAFAAEGFIALNGDRLHTAPTDATSELADAKTATPATPFKVYELRELQP